MRQDSKNKKNSKYNKPLIALLTVVSILVIVIWFSVGGGKSSDSGKSEANKEGTTTETTDAVTEETAGTNELQKNANEKINAVVNSYLTACKEAKMEELEKIVSNGEELTKEQVQKPYEYVEKIQNVDCYTLDGPDEGTYLVYVYYELKFVNVDTVAPGLMQLYISTTSDDSLVIMLDELDYHVEEAREAALARDDVKSLIATVNANLTEAANKDANLKALITKMNAQDEAAATQAPEATTAAQ